MIRGVGLATPLAVGARQTWEALLAGRFISDHARVPWQGNRGRAVGLATMAAQEAVAQAGWPADEAAANGTALVVGTSKGPVESWLEPAAAHGCGEATTGGGLGLEGLGEIASVVGGHLGLCGPRLTLSAACASGLHALIRGVLMIRAREAQRVLVVASESSLHPLFIGSFQRLGVLPPPGHGCRPYDQARAGFLMSEAAAAVCLDASESEALANAGGGAGTGNRAVIVDRVALAGDATHLTGSDPNAATLQRLLSRVIDGRGVDLVHGHGPGTPANDEAELAAIEACVAELDRPAVYSHKGALGHSLGAAGLVAVVINTLAHQHGIIPPNVRTQHPLPTSRVTLSAEKIVRPVRRSIALAAGFGGAMAAVSLRSMRCQYEATMRTLALLTVVVALALVAQSGLAEELTAERIRELAQQEDDRSSVPESLRIYPAAIEYEVTLRVWKPGEERKEVASKIPVREKLVGGKYLVSTFRPEGAPGDIHIVVFHDDLEECYRKSVLLPGDLLNHSIGTRSGESRSICWVSIPMRDLANVLIITHEDHSDEKSIWREIVVQDGRVINIGEGLAVVTKRPAPAR